MSSDRATGAEVVISPPSDDQAWDFARALLCNYASGVTQPGYFPDLEDELLQLPCLYVPPSAGFFLAYLDGEPAGCCAYRPRWDCDQVNACEMRRLYVAPPFRGLGLGFRLAEAVMQAARNSGFSCMLLDTLDEMEAARALYVEMGFVPIPPFAHGSLVGAHHLQVNL